ncbi:cache domain-containing protein [Granulosicoccaceae sp. 1_MG-2023]|nr:cache domain-containing protein [Granulosicoccaceae sp. 1_MG-2023]
MPERSQRAARPVRQRLLAIALLPMLVIMPVLLGIGVFYWNARYDDMLIAKVNGDLTIAHQYFVQILDNTGEHIRALGASVDFRDALRDGGETLQALLRQQTDARLDFLYLVSADGELIAASPAGAGPPDPLHWPVVRDALSGRAGTQVDIFPGEVLQALSTSLATRAQIELVPTANATPSDRSSETRGMVIHSSSPVRLPDGRMAALTGGMLLNRNLGIIDTINELVYQSAGLPEGSQGTATLFLDDVRISTNVRLFEDRRALGTRVSARVRDAVLGAGETWLDRAFVVNDWYISAYEPVLDSFGKHVGMIYVGFLEAPFRKIKYATLAMTILAFVLAAAVTIPVLLRRAREIFLPLELMNRTISRVESGDFSARTAIASGEDEITRVAQHLDDLLDQVQARNRELQLAAETLNDRVEARTRELREANARLELATRQLIVSEKLAAIGEITAGMAHEINNPVAVMQGNLDLLRSTLGAAAGPVSQEIDLIDEQLHRINLIVTRLLQFARPEEYAGYVESVEPAEVVRDCLPLVQHLLKKSGIRFEQTHTATRRVAMNRTELQQVLVNLIVNAIHAMPDGGVLRISDEDSDCGAGAGLLIRVSDTGVGIPTEIRSRIFDPFFTTKKEAGTGLGLSLSHTLIKRQGGHLCVDSEAGKGSTFTLYLPQAG